MKIYFSFLTVTLFYISVSRTIALDESSLYRPFVTTRNHRRLKGFTFDSFRSASQMTCALQCQRNPGCVSTNFRKASNKTMGVCKLNGKGVLFPLEEKELQYDKETFYTQFYDMKQDCQLTGCTNTIPCMLNKESKVFKCKALQNCAELYKSGQTTSGVYNYTIDPGSGAFDVFCDQTTTGGGWTVFQKRKDGSVDFYRDWADYKRGFGDLNVEFWLGLDKIHRLTISGNNKLRVDLGDWEGNSTFAEYDSFQIDNEASKYRLSHGSYSGSAGDSLKRQNGQFFTTKDQDNDVYSSNNCAVMYKGAWWYSSCHNSNLNGFYHHGGYQSKPDGVNWKTWIGHKYSLKQVEMKIRPADF